MKKYVKIIDGVQVVKSSNKIIITKNGMTTYCPSEEMILDDGWLEYVEPTYEPTEEDILKIAKNNKINEIIEYDSSENVNRFYIGEYPLWLDKLTRVGLKLRFEAELKSGKNITTLWYDGIPFEYGLENAIYMLNEVEIYASACYDNTQQHISNVKSLNNVDDVESYDYGSGYPDFLIF